MRKMIAGILAVVLSLFGLTTSHAQQITRLGDSSVQIAFTDVAGAGAALSHTDSSPPASGAARTPGFLDGTTLSYDFNGRKN